MTKLFGVTLSTLSPLMLRHGTRHVIYNVDTCNITYILKCIILMTNSFIVLL